MALEHAAARPTPLWQLAQEAWNVGERRIVERVGYQLELSPTQFADFRDPIPATLSPTLPRARTRKPSAKGLEGQQSLRTQTSALRAVQAEDGATGSPLQQAEPSIVVQSTQDAPLTPERAGDSSMIESFRNELVTIKEEQRYLKNKNAELQV